MTACIYYHPDAFTTTGPRLMGRNAAGESFLRGFLLHSRADRLWVQVERPEHAEGFGEAVARFRPGATVTVVERPRLSLLAAPGLAYHPAPTLAAPAFQRAVSGAPGGQRAWSLCGITHTTASANAMDAITALLTAPVQPWDALICTSAAVKDNVIRLLTAEAERLRHRLGATRVVQPLLPVIPLGIHTADFAVTEAARQAARAGLGIDPETLVVLFLGRLSFHAKAHPLAMYQALERAAGRTGRRVALIECGWHANAALAEAFAEAARLACPGVRAITLDGRDAALRATAWAAADVFCSLADNIQETFGLAPVEAMAAGLPVVVSDWDGYRDTVRDGVDGFRIPTAMPASGLAGDLAARHALDEHYDMYCGFVSSLVAVDIEAAARAFETLFASPELRRRMGEAGRERARTSFDWASIIPRYEALWEELAARRRSEPAPEGEPPHHWPARLDPLHAFAAYPTRTLTRSSVLALADADADAALARLASLSALRMVNYAALVFPSDGEVEAVIRHAASGPKTADRLLRGVPPARQPFVLRGLAWLLKLGILRLVD
jgi:starch synthase